MTTLEILYGYKRFDMGPADIGNFISGTGIFRAFSVLPRAILSFAAAASSCDRDLP
jgi:hypothetical protein